jgi:hypothetical protein
MDTREPPRRAPANERLRYDLGSCGLAGFTKYSVLALWCV